MNTISDHECEMAINGGLKNSGFCINLVFFEKEYNLLCFGHTEIS